MERWALVAMVGFAGLGVLVFLRVVSNEVALRMRALHLRIAAEEADGERERARVASANQTIHDVQAA